MFYALAQRANIQTKATLKHEHIVCIYFFFSIVRYFLTCMQRLDVGTFGLLTFLSVPSTHTHSTGLPHAQDYNVEIRLLSFEI